MSEFADSRVSSNENIKNIQKKGVKFTPDTLPGMLHLIFYIYILLYSLTHLLIYSLTHLLTYSLTHSLTHYYSLIGFQVRIALSIIKHENIDHLGYTVLTNSLSNLLTHSLTYSPICRYTLFNAGVLEDRGYYSEDIKISNHYIII